MSAALVIPPTRRGLGCRPGRPGRGSCAEVVQSGGPRRGGLEGVGRPGRHGRGERICRRGRVPAQRRRGSLRSRTGPDRVGRLSEDEARLREGSQGSGSVVPGRGEAATKRATMVWMIGRPLISAPSRAEASSAAAGSALLEVEAGLYQAARIGRFRG